MLKRTSVARSSVLCVSVRHNSCPWDQSCSSFLGMVGAGRTTGAPGFGANVHVNTLLNSPEMLTLERVPYTERLGKGSIVSDCNNSQIDFWEQIVIRVQMPSSSGNFRCWTTGENCSSPCECQTCSIPSAVLGLKACSLLPQITRHYQRLILEVTWYSHGFIQQRFPHLGLSSREKCAPVNHIWYWPTLTCLCSWLQLFQTQNTYWINISWSALSHQTVMNLMVSA